MANSNLYRSIFQDYRDITGLSSEPIHPSIDTIFGIYQFLYEKGLLRQEEYRDVANNLKQLLECAEPDCSQRENLLKLFRTISDS